MSQHNNTSNSICESWANPPAPTASLLKAIKSGPLAGKTPEEAKSKIASLRREDVSKATIFVGTGTCGLGAGAGKSLEAIKKYLSDKKIDAEIVEVGCIGLCSEEPIVDVQLPGKRRLSFKTVTEEKVVGVLDSVFVGKVSADMTL
nr:(2Fe-2S) ferredoxin domain-containing protein [bacterium]